MKANELRIGNWIEGIKMENPIRIINDSIAYNYYNERFEIDSIDIKYYKPIPLTEEWLLKFGFRKQENNEDVPYYFAQQSFNTTETRFNGLYKKGEFFALLGKGLDIIYVHSLQNLYFALTGEELTLK